MKRRVRHFVVYGGAAILLVACLGLAWYSSPARVENIDSVLYCACGYSKVEFKNGKITMIKFYHDDVKPGDIIGRYSPTNRAVQLEIYWKGKTNVVRYEMDNVGALAPSGSLWEYEALDSRSLKPRIHHFLRRFF